jgi:hypothetical protein
MQQEHKVLQKHKSFEILKRRDDMCILPSLWVLTKKTSPALTKLKASYFIKDCSQILGRDYEDTYPLTLSRDRLPLLFVTVWKRMM